MTEIGYFQNKEMRLYDITAEEYEAAAEIFAEITTLSQQRALTLSRLYEHCVIGGMSGFKQELNVLVGNNRGQQLKMKALEDLFEKKLIKRISGEAYAYNLTERGKAYIERNYEKINAEVLKNNNAWKTAVEKTKNR